MKHNPFPKTHFNPRVKKTILLTLVGHFASQRALFTNPRSCGYSENSSQKLHVFLMEFKMAAMRCSNSTDCSFPTWNFNLTSLPSDQATYICISRTVVTKLFQYIIQYTLLFTMLVFVRRINVCIFAIYWKAILQIEIEIVNKIY